MESFRAGQERPEPDGTRPGPASAVLGQRSAVPWAWHGHRRTAQQRKRKSIVLRWVTCSDHLFTSVREGGRAHDE